MKVLVLSLAGIGDTVMATPLIHELRVAFPDATIDAMVMWPGSRDLLGGNPHVSRVLQKNLIKASPSEIWSFLRELRRTRYDVSINTYPQSRIQYRLVAAFIATRKRLTHRYDCWNILDQSVVSAAIDQDYGLHAVENNLNLLKLLGRFPVLPKHEYEIFLSSDEHKWAHAFIGSDTRRILGIHVGSGTTKNLPLRRWPLESWIALLEKVLHRHNNLRILLFGGPEEMEDHRIILDQVKHEGVSVPETTNLRQAVALLEKCHVFLSVDTALMHLAAAAKVPHQLVIETPTFNKTVEPYGRPFTLVPNPMVAGRNLDYYRYDGKGIKGTAEHLAACMRSVTVEAVLREIENALTSGSL